jgi:hypothetical protein
MARVLEKLGGFKGKTIVVYSETGEPIGEYRLIEKYPTQSVQTVEKLIVLQDIDEYISALCHTPHKNKEDDIDILHMRVFVFKRFPRRIGKFVGVISGYNKHKKLYHVT